MDPVRTVADRVPGDDLLEGERKMSTTLDELMRENAKLEDELEYEQAFSQSQSRVVRAMAETIASMSLPLTWGQLTDDEKQTRIDTVVMQYAAWSHRKGKHEHS